MTVECDNENYVLPDSDYFIDPETGEVVFIEDRRMWKKLFQMRRIGRKLLKQERRSELFLKALKRHGGTDDDTAIQES